jgi:hypothetical protein
MSVVLQVKPVGNAPVGGVESVVASLPNNPGLEEEIDAMLQSITQFDASAPDEILAACMAYMGRCTELFVQLVRIEGVHRRAKAFRTMQLQKVMDLIDFEFKGASRLIEVRRQELDTSR